MRYTKRLIALLVVLAGAFQAGCLPIELSVSPKGEVLIPRQEGFCILDPASGAVKVLPAGESAQAAFGVFSPDGANILAISQAAGGGMGSNFTVSVMPAAGGEAKKLLSASNLTYARWSGDGKYVSLTRMSDASNPAVDENLPELTLVDVAQGTSKVLLSGVSTIHRWFGDSKSILILQIVSKDKDKGQYTGKLVKVNVEDGKTEPLATVLTERKTFLDLSPDGKKALLVALKAAKADEKVPASTEDGAKLFELDLTTGAVREVRADVAYAIYSPKGTKVLLGGAKDTNGAIELSVADPAVSGAKTIVSDAAKSAGSGMTDSVDIYPGWVNDGAVHYLRVRAVYGTAGKNLELVTVGANGAGVKSLQSVLDGAVEK